jgi:hypothetical protein
MHVHPSTCLEGPVSGARDWWREFDAPVPVDASGPVVVPEKPAPDDDPPFRADLVARIRRQIAEGTYGTEEQLEQALERLLKRLDPEAG